MVLLEVQLALGRADGDREVLVPAGRRTLRLTRVGEKEDRLDRRRLPGEEPTRAEVGVGDRQPEGDLEPVARVLRERAVRRRDDQRVVQHLEHRLERVLELGMPPPPLELVRVLLQEPQDPAGHELLEVVRDVLRQAELVRLRGERDYGGVRDGQDERGVVGEDEPQLHVQIQRVGIGDVERYCLLVHLRRQTNVSHGSSSESRVYIEKNNRA